MWERQLSREEGKGRGIEGTEQLTTIPNSPQRDATDGGHFVYHVDAYIV